MLCIIITAVCLITHCYGLPYATVHGNHNYHRKNPECSADKSHQTQAAFNDCSQDHSRRVFDAISELDEIVEMKHHLCSVLLAVRTECADKLRACFTPQDREQMTKVEVEQLKPFIIRMTRGKLQIEDIQDRNCNNDSTSTSSTLLLATVHKSRPPALSLQSASNVHDEKQSWQTESAFYDYAETNSTAETLPSNHQTAVTYNVIDLAEDARTLVSKIDELAKMTENLAHNTLQLIEITNLGEKTQAKTYPLLISTTRQPNTNKQQRLKRHKHGGHKNKKVQKDEQFQENAVKDKKEDNSLCTIEYTAAGKAKLEECSQAEARSLYSKILATSEQYSTHSLLCRAMARIRLDCTQGLQHCLGRKEVAWFMDSFIKQMERYLRRMVGQDGETSQEENCPEYDQHSFD